MRKIIYPLTCAMFLASSNLTAIVPSSSWAPAKQEPKPKVNTSLDFVNFNSDENMSYSFIVEAQMVIPSQAFAPGHTAFDTAPATTLTRGSALNFDTYIIPGVTGYVVISNKTSELSVLLNANYSNSPTNTKNFSAPDDSNIHIAGTGSETGDATEFSAAALTNQFKNLNGILSVSAFSLKNKSLAITSQVGTRVQYIQNNYHVRGTVAADDTFAGYLGNQESTAAELYTALSTSVLVYENDSASIAIGANLHFGAGAQYNKGFYNNYTETADNVRTVSQDTALPLITPSGYSGKELSLVYISKPQESTDTAYRLSIGCGVETLFKKDLIQSIAGGLPANINLFQANVKLTFTI